MTDPGPVSVENEPPRIYTPHKAIRRVTDHLVDHLAELEARRRLRRLTFHVAGSAFYADSVGLLAP